MYIHSRITVVSNGEKIISLKEEKEYENEKEEVENEKENEEKKKLTMIAMTKK